jgi:hypothetical protein
MTRQIRLSITGFAVQLFNFFAALLLSCFVALLLCCFAALLLCCFAALLLCCFAALLLCCFAALLLCCFAALKGNLADKIKITLSLCIKKGKLSYGSLPEVTFGKST